MIRSGYITRYGNKTPYEYNLTSKAKDMIKTLREKYQSFKI